MVGNDLPLNPLQIQILVNGASFSNYSFNDEIPVLRTVNKNQII